MREIQPCFACPSTDIEFTYPDGDAYSPRAECLECGLVIGLNEYEWNNRPRKIPAGYKLAPIQPTEVMLQARNSLSMPDRWCASLVYKAMILAAPAPTHLDEPLSVLMPEDHVTELCDIITTLIDSEKVAIFPSAIEHRGGHRFDFEAWEKAARAALAKARGEA